MHFLVVLSEFPYCLITSQVQFELIDLWDELQTIFYKAECCVDLVSHINPDSMKVQCTRVEENKSIVPSRTMLMYFSIQSLPQLLVIVYDHPPTHLDGHQLTE